MGKSKKRILNKNTDMQGGILKREDIIKQVIADIKTSNISEKSKNFISLFGITFEELSEAGASYEELSIVKHII